MNPTSLGSFDFVGSAIAALAVCFIFSLFSERALSLLFEWDHYKTLFGGRHLKPFIALVFAGGICYIYGVDFFSMAFSFQTTLIGEIATAAFIAGGSKSVISAVKALKAGVKEIKENGQ